MNNLKNVMSLMLLSLMATSCVNLDGQLDVKQVMTAKIKSGFLNRKTKDVQIQPDLYRAELKINGDKNFTLKLEGRNKLLIPIKSKNDFKAPSNGRVAISHNDINQPFDISGAIATDVSNSGQINQLEDCTWTVTENHCKKICDTVNSCHVECRDVQITVHGRREVEFHFRTTHRDVNMDLLRAGTAEILASFHGTNNDVDRVNDFIGACR